MPNNRFDLIGRVKEVEREYAALRFAASHALRKLGEGEIELVRNIDRGNLHRASDRLEGTYVIRLFSELEDVLRSVLRERRIRVPRDAKPLIDRMASSAKLTGAVLINAHRVRLYRNSLVHRSADRDPEESGRTMRIATRHLCTFLSFTLD